MITHALDPDFARSPAVDAEWVAATAEKVLAAVEQRRSTWQSWHVRAEAQRHVRAVHVPIDKVDQLVELLLAEVLQTRSVSLTRTEDGITEPGALRRADGSSVYTVAGSELFTSARILAAEQRLVTTARRIEGQVRDAGSVELALLESAANGNALDAGQAALVRSMCTSGARLQLAIAPAGAGKTTAMRTLARAWRDSGGHVIIGRGGSIRLIGDDQQLAAIGAGGVLRDIQASHGALRLIELHRFTDPAEAAATLAIRDGQPEALGFYLDRRRVHVGDPTATLDGVFNGWQNDRSHGLDAIMLAPTRELVSRLNQRARNHRLADTTPSHEIELADGNAASVGDLIITRANDRRLYISTTDWVKNGDRWTILKLTAAGGVRVRHIRNGRTVTLPAGYVSTATELGYASTVHTAQGVTADTMHGVVTGGESRQQLCTMLSRGRRANHIYLSVVGDGNPHTLIRPDTIRPSTATELLEQILARDGAPRSASTMLREQQNPAVRLGDAVERYIDALHIAAEEVVGTSEAQALGAFANLLVPGLTDELAWPTLRAHLLLLAIDGADPHQRLRSACDAKELISADDPAAVLDWRLDGSRQLSARDGPLTWLPGIPDRIAADPTWGPYLEARSHLVGELAEQVRRNAAAEAPASAAQPHIRVPAELIADLQLWRAAAQADPSDLRPTGPPQLGHAARIFQQQLDKRLAATDSNADGHWRRLLATEVPSMTADPFLPELEKRLTNLTRAGFDATRLLRSATAAGPLPDDHPAAALWWRILDQLPETPNQQPATPEAIPATRRTTTRPFHQHPPVPRLAPPHPIGPSR